MYSVSEAAKILKISNVSVYKKIKKGKELEPYVVKKDDKTYILKEGVELINSRLNGNKPMNNNVDEVACEEEINTEEHKGNSQLNEVIELNNKLINSLMEQLKVKDAQLEAKDKQIADQSEQILSLHKLIENNQVLLKEEQKARNEIKLISEESLKQHQEELDIKLEGIKEKMNVRASDEIKKKKHWWNRKKEVLEESEIPC